MNSASKQGVRDALADAYFEQLEPPMSHVAIAARGMLLDVAPHLDEVLKWGLPIYGQPKNILSIVAHVNWVNFQFFNGAHLSSSTLSLEGTGNNLRHVKLRNVETAQGAALRALVEQSLSLGLDLNRRQ